MPVSKVHPRPYLDRFLKAQRLFVKSYFMSKRVADIFQTIHPGGTCSRVATGQQPLHRKAETWLIIAHHPEPAPFSGKYIWNRPNKQTKKTHVDESVFYWISLVPKADGRSATVHLPAGDAS